MPAMENILLWLQKKAKEQGSTRENKWEKKEKKMKIILKKGPWLEKKP